MNVFQRLRNSHLFRMVALLGEILGNPVGRSILDWGPILRVYSFTPLPVSFLGFLNDKLWPFLVWKSDVIAFLPSWTLPLNSKPKQKNKTNNKKQIMKQTKQNPQTGQWWCKPLIPTLGRQRQENLCKFKARLLYREQVPGQSGQLRETLSSKQNKEKSPFCLKSFLA